jgi:hypothetical protein
MKTSLVTAFAAACALFTLDASAAKDKNGFIRVAPDEVAWVDRPGYDGMKFATISGDPSKPGV